MAGGRPRKSCSAMRRGRRKAEEAEELAANEQPAEAVQRDAGRPEEGRGSRAARCAVARGRPRKPAAFCGIGGCGSVRHQRLRKCAAPEAATVRGTGGCGSVQYRRLRQCAVPEAATVRGTGGCGSVRHRRLWQCAVPEAVAARGKPCSVMAQWPEEGRGSRAARWRSGRRKAEEAVQRDGAVAGGRPRKLCSAMAPWPEEGRGSRRAGC